MSRLVWYGNTVIKAMLVFAVLKVRPLTLSESQPDLSKIRFLQQKKNGAKPSCNCRVRKGWNKSCGRRCVARCPGLPRARLVFVAVAAAGQHLFAQWWWREGVKGSGDGGKVWSRDRGAYLTWVLQSWCCQCQPAYVRLVMLFQIEHWKKYFIKSQIAYPFTNRTYYY